MFDDVFLEQEQIDLLINFVESLAGIPREQRVKFGGTQTSDGTCIVFHKAFPGHNIRALPGDVEALASVGFLNLTRLSTGSFTFDVTPRGRKFYQEHRGKVSSPAERIETDVRHYVEADVFRTMYPLAFDKWSKADARLWANESTAELSVVGHLCREAMQEFVTVLVERYRPAEVDTDKAHHINRLKVVLRERASLIPTTLSPFLDALISYWGTLSDLVQRQEHAGQKEGVPVVWADAARVVFHTAVVFLEMDRVLRPTT